MLKLMKLCNPPMKICEGTAENVIAFAMTTSADSQRGFHFSLFREGNQIFRGAFEDLETYVMSTLFEVDAANSHPNINDISLTHMPPPIVIQASSIMAPSSRSISGPTSLATVQQLVQNTFSLAGLRPTAIPAMLPMASTKGNGQTENNPSLKKKHLPKKKCPHNRNKNDCNTPPCKGMII